MKDLGFVAGLVLAVVVVGIVAGNMYSASLTEGNHGTHPANRWIEKFNDWVDDLQSSVGW